MYSRLWSRPRYQEEDAASTEPTMSSTLRAMTCSHVFHQHCLFQWLYRHKLPTTDDDDEEED
jgi:hypothetical protein